MSTLEDRVTALESSTDLPALKIALTAFAVTAVLAALPGGSDPAFKSANASHQLGLAVIKDPDTYVAQAWLVIVASDDPLATAPDVTDELIESAVATAWPAMAGITS